MKEDHNLHHYDRFSTSVNFDETSYMNALPECTRIALHIIADIKLRLFSLAPPQ